MAALTVQSWGTEAAVKEKTKYIPVHHKYLHHTYYTPGIGDEILLAMFKHYGKAHNDIIVMSSCTLELM